MRARVRAASAACEGAVQEKGSLSLLQGPGDPDDMQVLCLVPARGFLSPTHHLQDGAQVVVHVVQPCVVACLAEEHVAEAQGRCKPLGRTGGGK